MHTQKADVFLLGVLNWNKKKPTQPPISRFTFPQAQHDGRSAFPQPFLKSPSHEPHVAKKTLKSTYCSTNSGKKGPQPVKKLNTLSLQKWMLGMRLNLRLVSLVLLSSFLYCCCQTQWLTFPKVLLLAHLHHANKCGAKCCPRGAHRCPL